MPLRAFLVVLLAVCACDSGGPPPVQEAGSFEATLTGDVEATLSGAAGARSTAGGDGTSLLLVPPQGSPSPAAFSLGFVGDLAAEGTYAIDAGDLGAAQATYRDGSRFLFGLTGTVRITRASGDRIEGAFEVAYAGRPRSDAPVALRAEGTFSAVRY